MSKWYGQIGYAVMSNTKPGVWTETYVERNYYGDLTRNARRLQTTDKVNDDITLSNEISIIADPYAMEHFHTMRYATFGNAKWKITNAEVQFPRIVLSLGGVYNGYSDGTTDAPGGDSEE